MACPSGCINGGGQIKSTAINSKVDVKMMISEFSKLFHGKKFRRPQDSPLVELLNYENIPLYPLLTTFHCVPKIEAVAPSIIKW